MGVLLKDATKTIRERVLIYDVLEWVVLYCELESKSLGGSPREH